MKYSLKYYCKEPEKIENYEKALADNFKGWDCHHRKGVDIPTEELKALDMYYNRPASELIFMKHSEHQFLHNKGSKRSDEAKNKMSNSWDYDKHFNEETRRRMSEAAKGNIKTKGTHWYNNGKINIMSKECPEGFITGRIKKA